MKKSAGRKERRRLIRQNRREEGHRVMKAEQRAKASRLYKKKRAKAKLARKQRKVA